MVVIPRLSDELEADIIHSILDVTSRAVTFTCLVDRINCPVCSGLNAFCLTCSGNTTIDVVQDLVVSGRVKWAGSDKKLYSPVGQYPEGDCVITLPASSSGTILPDHFLLETVLSVMVDNRACVVDKWYFRGEPRNRVYIVLNEDRNSVQRVG